MVVGCAIPLMAKCTGYNFISDLRHVDTNKIDCHDIAEILLKVALNNITLTRKLKNIKTLFDVVIGDG
jgi:hypothetical protein